MEGGGGGVGGGWHVSAGSAQLSLTVKTVKTSLHTLDSSGAARVLKGCLSSPEVFADMSTTCKLVSYSDS